MSIKRLKRRSTEMSPCHLYSTKKKNRQITEGWMERKIQELNLEFRYFLTLSFTSQQSCAIRQYLDNEHIKKVILDFFYPNRKPKDRLRIWFFVERHSTGELHLHILMEGMDGIDWLSSRNRKIEISKSTLLGIVSKDFCIDDVITEALTNHLQRHIRKLGKGKKSVDWRAMGEIKKRVHYINKSLASINFNNWEHVDFENSDLDENDRRNTKGRRN